MAKSAFDVYPRETAVRLILLMGGTGVLLLAAGFLGEITTFWAAGSIMILFAVASWPKPPEVNCPSPEQEDVSEASPACASHGPSSGHTVEEVEEPDDSILRLAKAQIAELRKELARQRGESEDSA